MTETKHGTSIAWTHGSGFKGETWNPVTGCSKVSPGCANCYAEALTARFAGRKGYIAEHRPWTPENAEHNVTLWPERLEQPLHWSKPRMVFVNSMSDLFHEEIPIKFIERVFEVMLASSQHVFQVLTKRPQQAGVVLTYLEHAWRNTERPFPLPNVWLGVSIENARFTWRADVLREIPAAVRFISAEPLLGSLLPQDSSGERAVSRTQEEGPRSPTPERGGPDDQEPGMGARTRAPLNLTDIDWLIVGGESGGRNARPMHPEWARELRDACLVQAVANEAVMERRPAFFFKQWGSWHPEENQPLDVLDARGYRYREIDGVAMRYAGAGPKSGGSELDGRTWDEMPQPRVRPSHSL